VSIRTKRDQATTSAASTTAKLDRAETKLDAELEGDEDDKVLTNKPEEKNDDVREKPGKDDKVLPMNVATEGKNNKHARRVWKNRDILELPSARGQVAKVKFYEVGLGTARTIEYYDQEPIGMLLDSYCTAAGVQRDSVKFEVWEYEVQPSDTISSLKRSQHLDLF
jgi:hypothetical protein